MTSMQENNESEELSRPQSRRRKREKKSKSVHPAFKGIAIVLLLFASLTVGLFVGFTVVGNGTALEVFDLNTYQHIYDLVFKTNSR